MKIAMIVHAYYLKDARVRRYAEALAKEGHQVDVLCLREDKEPVREEHLGVSIHRVNVSRLRGGMMSYVMEYLLSFASFFWKLNKLFFAGNRYQLIHVHNFPNFLVFASIIQKLFGSKILLDVHDPMPELFRSKFKIGQSHPVIRLLRLEERISIGFADAVIAANHAFREILAQRSCSADKISVILNAPDDKFYMNGADEVIARNQECFNILYIGTLAERYGLETVLGALVKIKSEKAIPCLRFTVIPKISNEGSYVGKLLKEIENLGLKQEFRLLEPVPHDKMPGIIREADLSVYTPLPDIHMDIALSLKIPEVIAVGRPLVVSRLSVLLRYFGEDALFMIEPGDVEGCAAKIVEIYEKPEDVRLRVQKSQEALTRFSWPAQKLKYLKMTEELTRGESV